MSLEIKEGPDLLDGIISRLKDGDFKKSTVGIHGDAEGEVLKYAIANEFGATIENKGGVAYGFKSKTSAKRGQTRFLKENDLNKGKGYLSGRTKASTIIIPPRPFIRQTFDKHKEHLIEVGVGLAAKVRDGQLKINQALFLWGETYNNLIQKEINEGSNFVANAKSTLAKKGGNKNPLQGEGRLQQSIKTVVE